MKPAAEHSVEAFFVKGVKNLGGMAYKFVSPGNAGVPDRMAVLPGGKIYFVELKREAGQLTTLQKRQISRLQDMGCRVTVLRGIGDVRNFLSLLAEERREEVMPYDV